jgi:hypothetical protein
MGEKARKSSRGRLDWLKHNIFPGKIPTQNSHWTMKRHLNNGQECKTGHGKRKAQGEVGG